MTNHNFKEEALVPQNKDGEHIRPGGNPGKPDEPGFPEQPGKPHRPPKEPITIIVNCDEKQLAIGTTKLTYEEIVRLAYGSYNDSDRVIYTVSFSRGPRENPKGTLVRGQAVKICEGMIFNVSRSDKS